MAGPGSIFWQLTSNMQLVGRDQDIAVVGAFIDDAARHGGSLLVSGEAGVGKTADSQVPWGVDALGGAITEPAWRQKPSWYLVTTEDPMIPPSAQRAMAERVGATVIETSASHSVYVSQPQAVADLIKQAAGAIR